MTKQRRLLIKLCLGAAGIVLACGPRMPDPRAPASSPTGKAVKVGPGFYSLQKPKDVAPPSNAKKQPVKPKVTSDFRGVPTSNDWWSSLIWQYDTNGENPHSDPLYAHPFSLRAVEGGLGLGYSTEPKLDARDYMYWYEQELLVGLEGVKFPDTKVAGYSDWAVTAAFQTPDAELRATFGHGLPFAYFRRVRGTAAASITAVTPLARANLWR